MMRRYLQRDREAGFTLVEVAVALGILLITLLVLARTAVVGFQDVGFGRQRQTANQIANQLLEEVRGLAYVHVTEGLADANLASDPNIFECPPGSGAFYFRVCPPDPAAEPIVHTPGLANVTPLVPHRGSFGPPDGYPNTYNWSIYVTEPTAEPLPGASVPEAGAFRVWAIVSWTAAQRTGLRNSVETQTLVFAPDGCLDLTTHPFSAPCQAFHQGTAAIKGGGASITGLAETAVFDGFAVDMLNLQGTVQAEQIARVDGTVTLPGGRRIVGGVETAVGRTVGTTQADGDPTTTAIEYDSKSVGPQPGGSVSVTGTGTQLTVSAGGSETGKSTSTVNANAGNPCTTQNDSRPCAHNTGTHVGQVGATVRIPEDGGTAVLFRAEAPLSPLQSETYARREVPVAGEDGLVRAQVTRAVPEVRIGGLPEKASPPVGWAGYWARLVGYTATLQSEAGVGTSAPTVAVTGQLEYWNGVGYTVVPVTSAGTPSLTPATVSVPVKGDNFGSGTAIISGTLEIKGATTSETLAGLTTRTQAQAVAGPPVFGEMQYTVTRGANTIVDLTVGINLGRSSATTGYQPAPSP